MAKSIIDKVKSKFTPDDPVTAAAKLKASMMSDKAKADGTTVTDIGKKLGLSKDTAGSLGDKAETVSKVGREFADEHGGKVAAATAAGIGALGLAKLLRRKKKDAAADEAMQQNI